MCGYNNKNNLISNLFLISVHVILFIIGIQVNKEELCFIGKGVKKTDSHFKDDLVETMKQNYANNPALKWQYVGTEDGVLHIYPASVNCQFTSESYDPRLR